MQPWKIRKRWTRSDPSRRRNMRMRTHNKCIWNTKRTNLCACINSVALSSPLSYIYLIWKHLEYIYVLCVQSNVRCKRSFVLGLERNQSHQVQLKTEYANIICCKRFMIRASNTVYGWLVKIFSLKLHLLIV